jgi:hypothetical protein
MKVSHQGESRALGQTHDVPVPRGGRLLVDSGVLNNLPVDAMADALARRRKPTWESHMG